MCLFPYNSVYYVQKVWIRICFVTVGSLGYLFISSCIYVTVCLSISLRQYKHPSFYPFLFVTVCLYISELITLWTSIYQYEQLLASSSTHRSARTFASQSVSPSVCLSSFWHHTPIAFLIRPNNPSVRTWRPSTGLRARPSWSDNQLSLLRFSHADHLPSHFDWRGEGRGAEVRKCNDGSRGGEEGGWRGGRREVDRKGRAGRREEGGKMGHLFFLLVSF